MKLWNVAIIGATGAVGTEILRLLIERGFPSGVIRCCASSQSVNQSITLHHQTWKIEELTPDLFRLVDLAFFCAGEPISLQYIPEALKQGCYAIDATAAFRMDPKVPLLIPEINLSKMGNSRLIASPNCIASILSMVLFPLHQKVPIRRIVIATYQAASGGGLLAMQELVEETKSILENRPYKRSVMPQPYGFNLFPHNAPMTDSHYNEEEIKIIAETRKLLEAPHLSIAVTAVRVPVLRAHSIAVNMECSSDLPPEEANKILSSFPGIQVLEKWEENRFPTPLDATHHGDIFVGRIRKDLSQPNTLDLWIVGDQLLKGAALNLVQIGEALVRREELPS